MTRDLQDGMLAHYLLQAMASDVNVEARLDREPFDWRAHKGEMIMPSKSKPQARLMAAAAHDPKFARKVGVPAKVAKEFNRADAGAGVLRGSGVKKK